MLEMGLEEEGLRLELGLESVDFGLEGLDEGCLGVDLGCELSYLCKHVLLYPIAGLVLALVFASSQLTPIILLLHNTHTRHNLLLPLPNLNTNLTFLPILLTRTQPQIPTTPIHTATTTPMHIPTPYTIFLEQRLPKPTGLKHGCNDNFLDFGLWVIGLHIGVGVGVGR